MLVEEVEAGRNLTLERPAVLEVGEPVRQGFHQADEVGVEPAILRDAKPRARVPRRAAALLLGSPFEHRDPRVATYGCGRIGEAHRSRQTGRPHADDDQVVALGVPHSPSSADRERTRLPVSIQTLLTSVYPCRASTPILPTEPALLVAAERHSAGEDAVVVHPDGSGPQPSDHAVRPADVLRPDAGGQAVGRVVGDPDGLVLALEPQQADDGAEDLLAGKATRVVDVSEDGRLHEEPRPGPAPAARQQRQPLFPAELEVGRPPCRAAAREASGPSCVVGLHRIPGTDLLRALGEQPATSS